MTEKAKVHYQLITGDVRIERVTEIEAKEEITVTDYGPADDLIKIGGDIKAIYVHRSHLVSIIIENAK